jgi:filamentous hemagglutinin family protein
MNGNDEKKANEKTGAFIAGAVSSHTLQGMLFFPMMLLGVNVFALPMGGVVSAGGASIINGAVNTTIMQSTQNAAINWQSFNIASGEAVQFVQPNSSSVVLNRVTGSNPSSILGNLSANGKVFLVNPNGILFGQGASVNVGGLVASTLNISDSDFMAGDYNFTGSGNGMVLNQGKINTNANGSYIALLGASVSNGGIISAKLGTVVLAAGTTITLDVVGDGLLNVTVNQGAVNAMIENGGLIQADGGAVLLTEQAAGNLMQGAVNNTGVIQAQTIENHNGTIRLLANMQSGSVNVSGTLDASAPNGGEGGFIETSGSQVLITDKAMITTQSAQGKTGTWLLDPTDFTIAVAGGNMTGIALDSKLAASNVTISSNNGLVGTDGDINVNTPILWAAATTLTLNAVHDVNVNAAMTANTAGANFVLQAGNDVNATAPIHVVAATSSISINASNDVNVSSIIGTAANTPIEVSAGHNLTTTGLVNVVAADSSISLSGGNNVAIGGPVTATAANSTIKLSAGQDATISAPINAVAAGSLIGVTAGRDLTTTTTAAINAVAAATLIDLSAGRNVSINSAIAAGAALSTISVSAGQNVEVNAALAASAAGSSISLLSGLDGIAPGAANGTVSITAAVASLNTTIRFNPNGYVNTGAEIAAYVAEVTGAVDAKAWVYVQGNNKIYDGTNIATLSLMSNPGAGNDVRIASGAASFDTSNAGSGKTVTLYGSQILGADAGKFALNASSGTTTANITPATLTVTASATNKTYDGTTNDVVNLAGKPIADDNLTLAYTAANFADENVGNAKVVSVTGINVSGNAAANYIINPTASGIANITPAPLTVTASSAIKSYGQTPILLAFTQNGLVNGETIGSVTESSMGTAATANVEGSPYAITPSKATGGTFSASNYSINYVNGELTVNPAGLTVTAANATKIYGQTMNLTAFTVAGLQNGETVFAFTETSPGTVATASVVGSPYAITLGSAGGGTFDASNYNVVLVNGLLTVMPVVQSISVGIAPVIPISAVSLDQAVMPVVILAEPPAELLAIVPNTVPF